MTKLTDMQLVLLNTAATRPDGSLLPPAISLGRYGDRIRRSVASLIKKTFATEIPVTEEHQSWRAEAEQLFGVSITELGRAAINETQNPPEATNETSVDDGAAPVAATPSPTTPRDGSKVSAVVAMLQRGQGATLTELVDATGWLPHTTRAALTGLRKKGHAIAKGKRNDLTCYYIAAA